MMELVEGVRSGRLKVEEVEVGMWSKPPVVVGCEWCVE